MATSKRKTKRFVIDVNCYVTIFINRETDWVLYYIARNKIEIFIDDNLIAELTRVLEYPKIKKLLPLSSILYVNFVKIISTRIAAKSFHINSPDPEDNYLFDLALSSYAKILVSGEKALLKWLDSPVETISLTTFKEFF